MAVVVAQEEFEHALEDALVIVWGAEVPLGCTEEESPYTSEVFSYPKCDQSTLRPEQVL